MWDNVYDAVNHHDTSHFESSPHPTVPTSPFIITQPEVDILILPSPCTEGGRLSQPRTWTSTVNLCFCAHECVRIAMAACLKHRHRYRLLFLLLTALHLVALVSSSCISISEQNRHVYSDSGGSNIRKCTLAACIVLDVEVWECGNVDSGPLSQKSARHMQNRKTKTNTN